VTCRPGHPARAPDFQKDNEFAVTHGAYSARKLAEVAEALRPSLAGPLEGCPWVQDVDGAEVDDWLQREALLRMLTGELARRMQENDGRIVEGDRWLLERVGAAQNRAQASRDRLLMNPLYRFRAGRDVAASEVDLARLWAREDVHHDEPVNAAPAAVPKTEA
jgi:hypothetical protein